MSDQPKDHAAYLRAWAADIRKHSGSSVDADRLDGIATYIERLRSAFSDFHAIYDDHYGVEGKTDADVCKAFEDAIIRSGL